MKTTTASPKQPTRAPAVKSGWPLISRGWLIKVAEEASLGVAHRRRRAKVKAVRLFQVIAWTKRQSRSHGDLCMSAAMSLGAPAFVIVAFAFLESKLRWSGVETDSTSACVRVPTSGAS